MQKYCNAHSFWAIKSLWAILKKIPRVMRLYIFLLVCSIGLIQAVNTYAQATLISLEVHNQTVKQVLDKIEEQSDFSFFINTRHVDLQRKVSVSASNSDIFKILDSIFSGTDVNYSVLDKKIILSINEIVQQEKKVTGMVKDYTGEPIIGANIMEKGTTNGTITNIDGEFSLNVPENATLVITYIGYDSQEINTSGKYAFRITLKEDTQNLEEVVVTALGIRREEKALGYSVQKVDGDKLNKVKSVDFATSLTGKVAGLNVANSTEFNQAPDLTLRGETPLLVIDGVPYNNITLREIASDDIESVDVLKGATASALYGARGGSGAIMITTKRGQKEGLNISVNSSTMFNAGYLRKPEVQTAYSSGTGGKYRTGDYVWGDKMDIGREALQYNPYTYEWEMQPLISKGKNNLKNFQENSFVTNNNINITQKGQYGSFRTSLTHVYNKGQWPNEKLNKITYTVAGEMNWKKFKSDAGITYNKRFYPNMGGTGYGGSGYLYNLLIWSGTDFDIRDYRNYWMQEDELSNWMDRSWYENPYLIANEITSSSDYDVINGFINASYEITPWLKAIVRSGVDMSADKNENQTPVGSVAGKGKRLGFYSIDRSNNFSINNDALLMAEYKWNDFNFDGFFGGNIYYWKKDKVSSATNGGLISPGFYSLNASVDPAITSKEYTQQQVNSLYGKVSVAWKSTVFADFTGRNDWSSTLPSETRSYFYPSVAGSVIMSEFIPLPDVIDFWKVRGSWTVTKNGPEVYDINQVYSITTNLWDNMTGAYTPNTLKNVIISPATSRSFEVGTGVHFFKNRLKIDYTYYNKLNYNNSCLATVSPTTGYTSSLINIDEEQERKGMEITVSGTIIKNKNWKWDATFNWARERYYYAKTDPVYSIQKPWVKKGGRLDHLTTQDYQRDSYGNIVHGADGFPLINPTATFQGYKAPDWVWGFSTSVSYRNLSADISFDGRAGGIAHAMTDQAMWNSGAHIKSDNKYRYEEVVNGNRTFIGQGVKVVSGSAEWNSDGNIISDDRIFAPNDKVVSYEVYTLRTNPYVGTVRTQNLLSQSFFKLRHLAVSYSVPAEWCSKAKLQGASIGFVGQNLWMWTKDFKYSDPDKSSDNLNSPSTRYVGFNVKLDF